MNLWQATIRISRPGSNVTDEAITQEISTAHAVSQKDLRAVKRLWGDSIAPLTRWERTVRKFHRDYTFEAIGDIRVVLITERDAYLSHMATLAEQHAVLRQNFIADYDTHLAAEALRLNGTFRREDYPSPATIGDRIRFIYAVQPMPEPNSFLTAALTSDVSERLAKEYQQRLENTEKQIRQSILDTMLSLIRDTADSLSSDGKIFASENKKSPIIHLQEYLARIPALNVFNDPQITELYTEASQKLSQSPATLRNPFFRQTAALTANNLAGKYAGFGGFGGTTRKIAQLP